MPMRRALGLLLPVFLGSAACATPVNEMPPTSDPTTSPTPAAHDQRPDPHSFSRPDQVRVRHMGLHWKVDFEARALEGRALLWIDRIDPNAPLVLDTRDLEIVRVSSGKAEIASGDRGVPELVVQPRPLELEATTWALGDPDPDLGTPLSIELREGDELIEITYRTRPAATGLQWLEPSQTAGKKLPFLYSQSQAIHGRSWIPCQDTPGVRTSWDAVVEVSEPFTAVMAAEMLDGGRPHTGDGTRAFRFVMPQPVPSYLIAIGVGDLRREQLGPRSAVWAEPSIVGAAAHEFADTETMISTAEDLFGPYPWGRYDVLVLPPAFPFGGMENPRLTFATPTILAGDRSLVALIAHELAHSWSGNLATNATWSDLWLNEGFTVYAERRIVEAIYGRDREEMEAKLGLQDLETELAEDLAEKPDMTKLAVDLSGRNPDDYFSSIPYEKGAFFLRLLEETYGREAFDTFFKAWFAANEFGSVDTPEFRAFLKANLLDEATPLEGKTPVDVDEWIDGTGLPASVPRPQSDALEMVDAEVKAWLDGSKKGAELPTKDWTPHEWLHFLRAMPDDLGAEKMAALDAAFSFTKGTNYEVLDQWLVMAARHRYEPAFDRMRTFLIEVGRRKFLTPVYRALQESEEGKAQALAIYREARPGYHAIARDSLDELLSYTSPS